ncbi:MAG: TonB-dependent receptor plug domain-containing protein [Deltaproteobacteria bacterium]
MKRIFCAFLLLVSMISPSAAEEGADGGKSDELDPVFVSATKILTPLSELGASVEIITQEDIQRRQASDVLELLRDIAGFTIVQSGSRGSLTSLFARGGESNFNLVLIDGVQVNDIGGSFDFSRLTLDNVEKIEIVKGPHSAIYGSDAVTSVINIITKRGSGKPSLGVSAALGARKESGGNLQQEYGASVRGGGNGYGYSLAYGRIDDNGIFGINNEFTNNTFSGALNFSPLSVLEILFTARYNDSRSEFPTEFLGDKFAPLDPDQFNEVDDLTLGASISFAPTSWWEHLLLIGIHDRDMFSRDNPNPDVTFFDSDSPSTTKTDETRFSIDYHTNVSLRLTEDIRGVATLGFEYENEEGDQSSSSSFGASGFSETRDNFAFYFQKQAAFFERLFITAGLRVDNNENFGAEISPRGSIAYLLRETGTKLRAGAGRGIKEPTIIEIFGLGEFVTGNPDLSPEESISWEAGVDQNLFGGMLELNATVFWNEFENLIAFSFAGFPNGTSYENIQEAEAKGVEVGAALRPLDGLVLRANYAYLDTEVTDDGGVGAPGADFFNGGELVRRPKHTFSVGANYLCGGLNLNLNGTFIGRREDLDFRDFPSSRVALDSYFRLDAAASYEIAPTLYYLRKPMVFIRAQNVLGESYEEVFGFTAPEFNFIAGVSFGI